MAPHYLPDGSLHAPYFVCVRCPELDDRELLDRLGLSAFQPATAEIECWHRNYLFVIRDREWAQIADNGCYELWHSRAFRAHVAALARTHELFTWWIGDSDNSYGFAYHRDGQLVREREGQDDSGGRSPVLTTIDHGDSLPGEPQPWPEGVGAERPELLYAIAEALGINICHRGLPIRGYVAPRER
jgi:hypothetical protein